MTPSILIRPCSILLLFCVALSVIACGRHRLGPDELERNQFFAEILERQDRRDLGDDDFFPKNLLHNRHPEVRQWCAIALGRIGSRKALPWLYESLRMGDAAVRSSSAFALGEIEDLDLLREQFLQPKPQSLSELTRALDDASLSVRMRVIEALGKIGGHAEVAAIAGRLADFQFSGTPDQIACVDLAITALTRLKDPISLPILERWARDKSADIRWRANNALIRLRDPNGLRLPFSDFHDGVTLRAADTDTLAPGMKTPWARIAAAYHRVSGNSDAAAKVALLKQLEPYLEEAEVQSTLLAALHDGERNARLVAAGLLRKSGNHDIPEDPGPTRPTASSLTYLMVTAARRDRTIAILDTTRGTIEIELFREDAPMTVSNFVSLANQGFYDGTSFMRAVPFFMVEGGDHPDGSEKRPDYSIRCEINMRPFERGSLGMANNGKDSGAARFFVTLAPQPQMDGEYTCFGLVTSGMEAAEHIIPGDRIRRIVIKEDVTMLDYRRF